MASMKANDLPDLGFDFANFYISESLTSYKKKTNWGCLDFNGRIFIKNTESLQAVAFDTEDDLKKFHYEHPRSLGA